MNLKKADEFFPIAIKYTDTLNEQLKTRPQETLVFKLTKPLNVVSLNLPLELEDEKCSSTVTDLEVNNSSFNINEHNKHLQPGYMVIGKPDSRI